MHETDLHLDPNEASDLCRVFTPAVHARRGWDRALLTVLDEACAEDALALLVHARDCPLTEGWEALRVHAEAESGAGRTEDAEACAVRDGYVYVLGSQFGKKSGPLSARRSWIARVSEEALADDGRARMEIARLRFGLHRAVNDALAAAQVELLPLGPRARESYIAATIAAGAEGRKRWAGRVTPADQPINVEAAEFRADGRLLLGLRYPVTVDGHPLLVEIHDVETLFADPAAVPQAGSVWWLEGFGTREAPTGFRGLDTHGGDAFDAIIGDLDASGKSATVLEDHPEGARAASEHVRFSLPAAASASGGPVAASLVHHFGDIRRVEGVAIDHEGHTHYVIDEEGHVALRTLLVE
jgi:hypothetical protein